MKPVYTISLAGLYWKENLATGSTVGWVLEWGWECTDFEGSTDYQGTGFAYDFLLGAGYRLSHDWSLQSGLPVLFNRSK